MEELPKFSNKQIGILVFIGLMALAGLGNSIFTGSKWKKRIQKLEDERARIEEEVKQNDLAFKEVMLKYNGLILAQDSIITTLKDGLGKSKVISEDLKEKIDAIEDTKAGLWGDIMNPTSTDTDSKNE